MSNITKVWHRMLYSCTHYPYGNCGRQRVNWVHTACPESVLYNKRCTLRTP